MNSLVYCPAISMHFPQKTAKTRRSILAFAFIAAVALYPIVHSATVVGVTIESFSSERGGFNRHATKSIDGDIGTNWQTNNDATKTITFDLGAVYLIDSFFVANYSIAVDNSDVKDITFNYGTTTGLGSTLGTITFASRAAAPSGETINLASTISARYIQFDVDTMHFADASLTSTRAGLAEVSFNAIPEPSSAALIGLFGLAMVVVRRRRS